MNENKKSTICMLGFTGAGKSTLANELLQGQQDVFKIGNGTNSCTNEIQIVEGTWFDGNGTVRIIDVPGYGDGEGRDMKFTDMILQKIKPLGTIQLFCFVFREGRASISIWEMLDLYQELFGEHCWEHIVCIITFCDPDFDDTIQSYEASLKQTEDNFKKAFYAKFKRAHLVEVLALSLRKYKNGKRPEVQAEVLNRKLEMIKQSQNTYDCSQMKRAYTIDFLQVLSTTEQNYSDVVYQKVQQFLEEKQLTNEIKKIIQYVDSEDLKKDRISQKCYVLFLIENSLPLINNHLQKNLQEILNQQLEDYTNEVQEWVSNSLQKLKQFGVDVDKQAQDLESQLSSKYALPYLFVGTILKKIASKKILHLFGKNEILNRDKGMEKAQQILEQQIKDDKESILQGIHDQWSQMTKDSNEKLIQKLKFLGLYYSNDEIDDNQIKVK